MAHYMSTPLGRDVPLGDWPRYYQDAILKVLYSFRSSSFNPGNIPLAFLALGVATNIPSVQLAPLCQQLVTDGMLEHVAENNGYRITEKGVRFVVAVLRNPLEDAS